MPAVRFSNTYRASPIRAMYFEKNHKKYVKDYIDYHNNSEVYTSKKIKNIHTIDQNNKIFSMMIFIIMSNCF